MNAREVCAIVDVQVVVYASCGHKVCSDKGKIVMTAGELVQIAFDARPSFCSSCGTSGPPPAGTSALSRVGMRRL